MSFKRKIDTILIANRGEIAVRIMKTAKRLGIKTVGIYTENDKNALHVRLADFKFPLKGSSIAETYLNREQIVHIALQHGADAIHPGYGFLSENENFASLVEKHELVFIGPSPQSIKAMGSKMEARRLAIASGLPVVPSLTGSIPELLKQAKDFPFPVLVKASGGGGGKGMRIVASRDELSDALKSASGEALRFFGDPEVFIEKYVVGSKHIEIQVFGDGKGHVVHLFDRECSVQRRYQKIIEEAPSPSLEEDLRHRITSQAVKFASDNHYRSAGTLEFILTPSREFYFLEMNTRIQVEHPVTELITGLDIVEMQIKLAETDLLPLKQEEIKKAGHAIEARLYAEDPARSFIPSPGLLLDVRFPESDHLRIDSAVDGPSFILPDYDPMIAKLIAYNNKRIDAIDALHNGLTKTFLPGIKTNLEYVKEILCHPEFRSGEYTTLFCEKNTEIIVGELELCRTLIPVSVIAEALALWYNQDYLKRDTYAEFPLLGRDFRQLRFRYAEKEYSIITRKLKGVNEYFFENKWHTLQLGRNLPAQKVILDEKLYHLFGAVSGNDFFYLNINGIEIELKIYSFGHGLSEAEFEESGKNGSWELRSPIHGKLLKIHVAPGQQVKKGELLLVIEAMKMENHIQAPGDGIVKEVSIHTGQQVNKGQPLLLWEDKQF